MLVKLTARSFCLLLGILAFGAHLQVADAFPLKPIRLIVPYPPGGSPDLVARTLAPSLAEKLGQAVVIENRTGANGLLATEAVARSPADGYTLLLASDGPIVISPLLKQTVAGALQVKLAPITLAADSAFVLLASPNLPFNTLPELIKYARENPGKLTFGSSGIGSQHHLAGLLLASVAGLKLVHVPYKGFGDAVVDVTAGRVDLLFGSIPAGAPHISSGRLKGLAVTGMARAPLLPEVATSSEQGFSGLNVSAWFGVMAPIGTPAEILNQIDQAIRAVLASDAQKMALTKLGLTVIGGDRNAFESRVRQDTQKWAEIIRISGVKSE